MKKSIVLMATLFPLCLLAQQIKDTAKTISLKEIIVNGIKTVRGTGHMPEVRDGIIYAGKKENFAEEARQIALQYQTEMKGYLAS